VREESAGLDAPPCHPSRVFLNSRAGPANEKIPTRKDAKDNEIICHDELKMQIILLIVTMTH
jgi:hypothetical protein